jgi:endonuclease/exonuclease/phosphatase family metal-dependent hydrolase
MKKVRIATYNIHKCIGLDRRFRPERIVKVLREIEVDVIALQEVLCYSGTREREHQAEYIARELGMEYSFGHNRHIKKGRYGNAILSRFKIQESEKFDISIDKREPRGCLRARIGLTKTKSIQFFNLHLGTSFFERRKQVHKLLAAHVLDDKRFTGKRLIAGDFNEWTNGLTTRLFSRTFKGVDAKLHLGKSRTYPGVMPFLHLDHIYFDKDFRLQNAFVHRSRTSLIASDHLPIVAEFDVDLL